MNEGDVWLRLKKATSFTGRDLHINRIESHSTSIGFPDVEYCYRGRPGQIELKFARKNEDIKLRPSQHRWLSDRVAAGGNPLILTGIHCPETKKWYFLLHHGRETQFLIAHKKTEDWLNSASRVWDMYIDPKEILNYMESPWLVQL